MALNIFGSSSSGSGGSLAKQSYVADGSGSEGDSLYLNDDGTVKALTVTTLSTSAIQEAFATGSTSLNSAVAYDPDKDRVVVLCANSSGHPVVTAGVVVGTTITFGLSVTLFSQAATANGMAIAYDPVQEVWLATYIDDDATDTPYYQPFTVSSSSVINAGTRQARSASGNAQASNLFYDADLGKFVNFVKSDNEVDAVLIDVAPDGTNWIVTNSGSTDVPAVGSAISSAYAVKIDGAVSTYLVTSFVSSAITARTVSINGDDELTTIDTRTDITGSDAVSVSWAPAYDPFNKFVLVPYRVGSNLRALFVEVLANGDMIRGEDFLINTGTANSVLPVFQPTAGKFVVFHELTADNTLTYRTITATDINTAVVSSEVELTSNNPVLPTRNAAAFIPQMNYVAVVWYDTVDTETVIQFLRLPGFDKTPEDFIGIADADFTDGVSFDVDVSVPGLASVSTKMSGLIPKENYYLQYDGSFTTKQGTYLKGTAISPTALWMGIN